MSVPNSTLPSLAALTLMILTATTAPAVDWVVLDFEQLSFISYEPIESAEFSAHGRCVVEYGKNHEFGWLNVVAMLPDQPQDPVWIVRNMPLADISWGPPVEQCAYRFPMDALGAISGWPLTDIQYAYAVDPEPMSDMQGEMFALTTPLTTFAAFRQAQVQCSFLGSHWYGIPKAGEPWTESYPPYPGGWWGEVIQWIGCDMPNIPLNRTTNQIDGAACGPAACANSMAWLDSQHPEIDVPDNLRDLMTQLSTLMNRAREKGVGPAGMAKAKLDFIEAHNLPIHVKVQRKGGDGDITSSSGHSVAHDTDGPGKNWPSADWIKAEMAAGEDVEMGVGFWYKDASGWHRKGGHYVVLTGAGTCQGNDWVTWKHDAEQSTDGGTVQEVGHLVDTGDGLKVVGMSVERTVGGSKVTCDAYVEDVVSESFDPSVTPPPSQETFDDYCDYITRTIAPGDSLWVDFPNPWPERSMDVTIYCYDRSTDPPKRFKCFRWTDNAGRRRCLVNNNAVPITISIHNDDMEGELGWFGGYIPYPVALSTTKGGVTGRTDPPAPDGIHPSNVEETAGFSLGGNDGESEFGPAIDPIVFVDNRQDMYLEEVPSTLGVPGGTFELWLTCQIPMWNPFWEHLGLVVDVLEVAQAGDLTVECPGNGFIDSIPIMAPGRYKLLLGQLPPAPDFQLRLVAQTGLQMTFDAIGVPTVVSVMADVDEPLPERPDGTWLAPARPNPFNPSTEIAFALAESGPAKLAVYDVAGRLVTMLADGVLAAGPQKRTWDGRNADGREMAAGTYIYRLEADGEVFSRKMQLVK